MSPDRLALAFAMVAGIILLVGLSAAMLMREARLRDIEARVMQAMCDPSAAGPMADEGLAGLFRALGQRIRHAGVLYSQKDIDQYEGLILAAGLNPQQTLPLLLVSKLVMMVLLPVLVTVAVSFLGEVARVRIVAIALGVVAGIVVPERILGLLRRPYLAALERGAPDALDLMVVCSEAGMGLESALERVSGEMYHSNRPMAIALAGLLNDLRMLPDRRKAFANFGNRSGVEGLQRLAAMLGQALQYGTPLSQALRGVANELRHERMNKLEEKAVRLPALLIFPLIFFIMPSLYIVLLGTSFLQLYDALSTFTSTLPTHN
jgi:tight adherence protein C